MNTIKLKLCQKVYSLRVSIQFKKKNKKLSSLQLYYSNMFSELVCLQSLYKDNHVTQPFLQSFIPSPSGGDRSVLIFVGKHQYFKLIQASAVCGVAQRLSYLVTQVCVNKRGRKLQDTSKGKTQLGQQHEKRIIQSSSSSPRSRLLVCLHPFTACQPIETLQVCTL